ncbi:hypothetical protein ACIBI4_03545 [Streptomyces sp. NPDC050418]|uniref:hypothetical protein n=1 Tax=Streptomyces sp. NPDC050418 TaxID=3365612 RepID=UPI0037AFB61C
MSLHADLTALFARAGLVTEDVDAAVADGCVRAAAYQRVIAVLAASHRRDGDRALVATLARDPDAMAAKTAVVALVDRVAWQVSGPAEFRQWADGLAPGIDRLPVDGCRSFIHRRIEDWLLFLSVRDGHVPAPEELERATYWMQRRLAEESMSPAVLDRLASSGCAKKIRNIARNRAASREVRAAAPRPHPTDSPRAHCSPVIS